MSFVVSTGGPFPERSHPDRVSAGAEECPGVIPEENRFESDPEELVSDPPLPDGWEIGTPDAADRFTVARLTHLLRAHERHGRGWAGAARSWTWTGSRA